MIWDTGCFSGSLIWFTASSFLHCVCEHLWVTDGRKPACPCCVSPGEDFSLDPFSWDFLGKNLFFMAAEGFIYFTLNILIQYRFFLTHWWVNILQGVARGSVFVFIVSFIMISFLNQFYVGCKTSVYDYVYMPWSVPHMTRTLSILPLSILHYQKKKKKHRILVAVWTLPPNFWQLRF